MFLLREGTNKNLLGHKEIDASHLRSGSEPVSDPGHSMFSALVNQFVECLSLSVGSLGLSNKALSDFRLMYAYLVVGKAQPHTRNLIFADVAGHTVPSCDRAGRFEALGGSFSRRLQLMATQAFRIVGRRFAHQRLMGVVTGGAHQPRIAISPTLALFES